MFLKIFFLIFFGLFSVVLCSENNSSSIKPIEQINDNKLNLENLPPEVTEDKLNSDTLQQQQPENNEKLNLDNLETAANDDPNVQSDIGYPSHMPKELLEKFHHSPMTFTKQSKTKLYDPSSAEFKNMLGLKTSYGGKQSLFDSLGGGGGGGSGSFSFGGDIGGTSGSGSSGGGYRISSYGGGSGSGGYGSSGTGGYGSYSSSGSGGYGGSGTGDYGSSGIKSGYFTSSSSTSNSSGIGGFEKVFGEHRGSFSMGTAGTDCSQRPKSPMNASLKCTSLSKTCKASCMPNYQFPNGETNLYMSCVNGEWIIKDSEWHSMPSCEPICMPPCLNNGICMQPGQCMCPDNFSGPQCQYEKKLCISQPPLPKNSKRSCSSTACTITCANGYRFPDGTSVTNMICKDGEWTPTRPELATVPDCQPTCTPQCQNGGHCLSFNVCQCPPIYRGPQCQYSVDVCSPKKLNFNGAYNCSGNNEAITCRLSCPQSIEFEFAPATQYICSYDTGIFKPTSVPQCKYAPGMKVVHIGGGAAKSTYKTYNHTMTGGGSSMQKHGKFKYEMHSGEDDDEDESWEKIVTKTKIRIKSKGKKKKGKLSGYYDMGDIDEGFEGMHLPGIYSLYLESDANVIMKTPKPAICMTWNGNKIKTFDGLMYNIDLYCAHTLVQDIVDGSFNVILRSCPYAGGNDEESNDVRLCTTGLIIYLQSVEYKFETNDLGVPVLSTAKKQFSIPVQLPGMRVSMVGHNLRINLEAVGVTITWDTNKLVALETTAALWNRTAGLCGTFDQNLENDFRTKDGSRHKLASTFVDAWRAPSADIDKKNCIMEHKHEAFDLQCKDEIKEKAVTFCSKLLKNPKLGDCMKECDRESLLKTCVSDYCYCKEFGHPGKCSCDGLSAFVKDCQFRGIKLDNEWRDMELCAAPCKKGRIYKSCGPSFEPSCGSATEELIDNCNEGCFCPNGTLQYDGECIEIESCPCTLRGKVFKAGSEITKECNTCKCDKGVWKCSDLTCGARCGAIGDPHYNTFDGRRYDFMGKCSYYLMKTNNFTIEAENVACPGTISESMNFAGPIGFDMPSCTKSVTINLKYDGSNKIKSVKLKQGRIVLVDGYEIQKLPIKVLNGVLRIKQASATVILVLFDDGLKLWWDGNTRVYIDAPPTYRGRTKGLCGTFNSNMQDDFLTPEGDVETSTEAFADKWRTKESCEYIMDSPAIPHPCQLNVENKERAKQVCKKLKEKIFDECHWSVDPEPFYEDCMYDICACKGDIAACMCPIFGAYANECARLGVIVNWRYSVSECAVQCPPGQIFEECGDECFRTCEDLQTDIPCKKSCVEGCRCPPGQVLDETNECIPNGMCSCVYKGLTFKTGYKEVRPGTKYLELCTCSGAKWKCIEAKDGDKDKYPPASDLRTQCLTSENEEFTTCEPDEPITCKNMHNYQSATTVDCHAGCVCRKGYVYDVSEKKCVLPSDCSCHHGSRSYNNGDKIQSDCNTCECKSGNWNCTKRQCPATCISWGDSHFETYDGKDYDFQGACSYVLSKGVLDDGEGFSITIQNVLCGSMGVTCSKSVTIAILGEHSETITLSADSPIPGVKIADNKQKNEVIKVKNSNKVYVHRAGIFIVVEVPGLGLQVKWDRGTRVYVKLGIRWKGRVQGLCGNYNGDVQDDLKTPSSGVETNPLIFGDSWKLQDVCAKPTEQIDSCLEHPQRKTWAQRKCGILKSSVFAACHSEVPFEKYLKRCLYDSCACDQGGDCECLCTALAAYAYACTMKGVPIKWRTEDLCPMQCDPYCSNYSPCVSTCAIETCDNILEQGKDERMCMEDSCVEGCQLKKCLGDKIYLNDSYSECVPREICKPTCMEKNGVTYYEGDIIHTDNCQTCRCTRGKEICSGEKCTVTTVPTSSVELIPTIPPYGDSEHKCKSGWSVWINQDKGSPAGIKTTKNKGMKIGDTEPLPNYLLMKNLNDSAASCTYEFMTEIECRTAGTHIEPKMTDEDVECSLEKGLLCAGPCHDYEIRVYCNCNEVEEFVTKPPPITRTTPSIPTYSTGRPTPLKMIESTTSVPFIESSKCDPAIPHVEYPGDCYKFLHCTIAADGTWEYVEKTCGPTMMFNPKLMICDWIYSVQAIKPDCGEDSQKIITEIPLTWEPATPRPRPEPIKEEKCPPHKIWSECAVPCGYACHFYGKYLTKLGLCHHGSEACEEGCIDETATLSCPAGKLWRDNKLCVNLADCNCMSYEGTPVKPGAIFKESDCEVCQCVDNSYICDTSDCRPTKKPIYNETGLPTTVKTPTTGSTPTPPPKIITNTTVTPPTKCDPKRLVPMIESEKPLSDAAFDASSYLGPSFKPMFARLHSKPTEISSGSWSPEINDQMQYLQIAFDKPTPLFGVIIRGSPIFDQYVTSFKILHSYDGIAFHYLVDDTKKPQIFSGPIDSRTPVQSLFKIPIESKVIRIYPLTWHSSIAVRVELLGCSKNITTTTLPPKQQINVTITTTTTTAPKTIMTMPTTVTPVTIIPPPIIDIPLFVETEDSQMMCDDPMGLDNGKIKPNQVKFSSFKIPSTKQKPFNLLKLTSPNGWQPFISSPNEWILFDFLEPRNLTGLKTQGGDYGWVTGFNVLYSPDNFIWNKVQTPDGKPKVFIGNFDSDTVKETKFKHPIQARYLKIVPTKWHDTIELKVEPLGCFKPYPNVTEVEEITEPAELTTPTECGECPGALASAAGMDEKICSCYPPLFWNGDECVSRSQCPCMVGHIAYDVGAQYELDDCSTCVCILGGVPQCKPQNCSPCKKGLRPVKSMACTCLCEPCPDGEVICESSGACIPEKSWCDGITDCPDDEVNCAHKEKETPKVTTTVNETITIVKTCPEPYCPPGFTIKPSEQKPSEPKLSAMFQQSVTKTKTINKNVEGLKTSGVKGGGIKGGGIKGGGGGYYGKKKPQTYYVDNSTLAVPKKMEEKQKEMCLEFICIPDKPKIDPTDESATNKPIICPEPECPKGYDVVMDNFLSPVPNECAKFTCEQSLQKDYVCNVTGRTFNTFDGTEFKYDICNHLLARDLTGDKWKIIILKNCTYGNYICNKQLVIKDKLSDLTIVLYTDLTLNVDGYPFTVDQLQKSKFAKMKSFVVSKVGNTIVFVSHLHSFWVTFDQYGDVKIGVCASLTTTIDGLCGYYNLNPFDDKRLPNGEVVQSTIDFGDGWLMDKTFKRHCEPHACPKELQDTAWDMCNAIKHETFGPCTHAIDINRFVSKCLETACDCLKLGTNETVGPAAIDGGYFAKQKLPSSKSKETLNKCKCAMLQNFVVDCLAADENIHLDTWRSIHECSAICPAPLIHKDCYRRRCEPSCESLALDACPHLPGTCFSGCYCPDGTVRKGEQCVPVSDCKDCVCDGFGKSQYLTYDRKNFTFDGNCTYLLSRDILVKDIHTFQVYVTLGPCNESPAGGKYIGNNGTKQGVKTKSKPIKTFHSSGSCAQSLHILFGPHIIHLQKRLNNSISTIVDGIEVKRLPINKPWIDVKEQRGREININLPESQIEISALFEDLSFSIRVPSIKYGFKMEGLCGDCNGNPDDDLKPNPKTKTTIENLNNIKDIADSWLADDPAIPSEQECLSEELATSDCIPLPPEDDPCFEILDQDVFGQCHLIVDPIMYLSSCQQDMCKTGPNQEGACAQLAAYARECARNGFCIDWKTKSKCNEIIEKCPYGMSYEPCGCPETCETIKHKENILKAAKSSSIYSSSSNLKASTLCTVELTEGCFCPKGKVNHNGKCILENQCNPCDEFEHYPGDKWYPDKCTECECTNSTKVQCTKKECSSQGTVCEKGWKQIILEELGECCPTYKCIPELTVPPPLLCPDTPLPNCGPDQYNKMETDKNGCNKYICECKPIDQCEPLKTPEKPLLPGEKIVTEPMGCCPINKIICDKSLCPIKPEKCNEEFYDVIRQNEPDDDLCCDLYKCEPPKDKCIVRIMGKNILKRPDELWPTDDPCLMKKCSYGPGGSMIVTDEIETCSITECKPGFKLNVPERECCGNCIQDKCIFDDVLYDYGKKWASDDNCTDYECTKLDNQFIVTSSKETCPDVSDCPDNMRYFKGCCQHCKLTSEAHSNCSPMSLSDVETIKLVQMIKPVHGKCENQQPIRGFTECQGSCMSGTKYNRNSFGQDRTCKCCSADNFMDVDVTLTCDDYTKIHQKISVPESCSCRPCEEDAQHRKDQLTYGVKSPIIY